MLLDPQAKDSFIELLEMRASLPPASAFEFLRGPRDPVDSLTYAALHQKAKAVAGFLGSVAKKGDCVILLYPAGPDYIISFLGCLLAGVVAVPLYPPRSQRTWSRVAAVIDDCDASIGLTLSSQKDKLVSFFQSQEHSRCLALHATDLLTEEFGAWRPLLPKGDDLAFLQYTSGSTGTPKGVMVSHGNLMANEAVIARAFQSREDDIGLNWLPFYHDMGLIGNVLHPIYKGFLSVLMPPINFLRDPLYWLESISRYRATICGGPNFAYELLLSKLNPERLAALDLSCWRRAYNGSEPVRAECLSRFAAAFSPFGFRKEAFYPCYGMAESTLLISGGDASAVPVVGRFGKDALSRNSAQTPDPGKESLDLVSCGYGYLDHKLLVVDPDSMAPLPSQHVGEIWVSGTSVAKGYWNQPEANIRTFQAQTSSGQGPFLRTGDLGFFHDGNLFITGRLKDLIIIRGRNHYPQDIEWSVECCHELFRPGGSACFSILTDGEERLVVAQEIRPLELERSSSVELVATVRAAVAENHEVYAYAVIFLKVGGLPKTSSGKIQRSATRSSYLTQQLPVLYEHVLQAGEDAAGSPLLDRDALLATPVQERSDLLALHLSQLVAACLKRDLSDIPSNQALNQLGLDSLNAVDLQFRIETGLGIQLDLSCFFDGVSLDDLVKDCLARVESQVGDAYKPIIPALSSEFPLSANQESLWFLHQFTPESAAHHIVYPVNLYGPADEKVLGALFDKLVERHPALRTTFHHEDGKTFQRIHNQGKKVFKTVDANGWTEERVDSFLESEARHPFNLGEGPLMRALLLQRSHENQQLLLCFHHMVMDFWSFLILMDELRELFSCPHGWHPRRLPCQYGDYVNTQADMLAGPEGERLWRYWQQQLGEHLPILDLPTDHIRPPLKSYQGASFSFKLEVSLAQKIHGLSKDLGITLYTTLMAAFKVLLSRYSGQEDLMVGSASSGRGRPEYEDLVGFFVNLFVLRADLSNAPTFNQILQKTQSQILGALQHQDYPFQALVKRLQPERDPSRSPLFQAVFVLQKAYRFEGSAPFAVREPGVRLKWGDLELESRALEMGSAQFDLALYMAESGDTLAGLIEFSSDLFELKTISRLADNFKALLARMLAEPDRPVNTLPMLSEQERHQVLTAWNQTRASFEINLNVQHLFEAQVERSPEHIALYMARTEADSEPPASLSFRDLNEFSNRIAYHLMERGVAPEVSVGICMSRSLEMVAGLLGILKAGGTYVPMDPNYPQERLAFIAEDAQIQVLLIQACWASLSKKDDCTIVRVEELGELAKQPSNPKLKVHPEAGFYITHTSGSTGKPKGVLGTHRMFVNRFQWMWHTYPFGEGEWACQKTSLSFGDSVWEIFGPILQGVPNVLIPQEAVSDAPQFIRILADWHISRLLLVPSLLRALLENHGKKMGELKDLKFLTTSGEEMPLPLYQLFKRIMPETTLLNLYGASEVCADVTCCDTDDLGDADRISIGKPIANKQIYILDPCLNPTPVGIPGQLCIGGKGISRGYINSLAMTAERFIPDPFGTSEPGRRLFQSGDRARFLSDGSIEYLGRVDHQVKLRGYRIEPGEIEACLLLLATVREAVVILREDSPGQRRLVAYARPSEESMSEEKEELKSQWRSFLSNKLPEYMVPSAFVVLEVIPLVPSGKRDRAALPLPDSDGSEDYVAPRDKWESELESIWADVLACGKKGINANFFDLGGHSLKAIQAASRIEAALGVKVPIADLFMAPTPALLAEVIREKQPESKRLELLPAPKDVPIPLSFAQHRLWLVHQMGRSGLVFHMPATLRMIGRLDKEALRKSFEEIIKRHDSLRTVFQEVNGLPVQVIQPFIKLVLPMQNLQYLKPAERMEEAKEIMRKEANRPFDLEHGPLIRLKLVRLAAEDHVISITKHHIISDGWSTAIMIRELAAYYRAYCAGETQALPELAIQYSDYSYWQRQWLDKVSQEKELAYWQETLRASPTLLELPTDRPRPAQQTYNAHMERFEIDPALLSNLNSLAKKSNTTLYTTLLAVFNLLLARYSQQNDIVVGTTFANRDRPEVESLIGFFVNILALRADLSKDWLFPNFLDQMHQVVQGAYAHHQVPFDQVVEAVAPEISPAHAPLFQVLFELQTLFTTEMELPDLKVSALLNFAESEFDLNCTFRDKNGTLEGTFSYNTDLFESQTITAMIGHYSNLLASVATHSERCISKLDMLSKAEQRKLLEEWNNTGVSYPLHTCVPQLLEAQADQTPDKTALWCGDQTLAHGEWHQISNRLAHYLVTQGVGPEVVVALLGERNLQYWSGVLAIMKAGGVYLPLAPVNPADRLAGILEQSAVHLLLVIDELMPLAEEIKTFLPENSTLSVLSFEAALSQPGNEAHPQPGYGPDNLAYAIYTSGSTGTPKGAMLHHLGFNNHLHTKIDDFGVTADDIVAQNASQGFDVSLWQAFTGPLAGGGTQVIGDDTALDAAGLLQEVSERGVTVLEVVPSQLQVMVEDAALRGSEAYTQSKLRWMMCNGEVLAPKLCRQWLTLFPKTALVNAWGLTECSDDQAQYYLHDPPAEEILTIPIGKPLGNMKLYILDKYFELMPTGVPGRLFVGGICVGRGYMSDPKRTAAIYLPNPMTSKPGQRLYDTGDMARYQADGNVDFIGRRDFQVKVRGFRIELGDIEAATLRHEQVQNAVVIAREEGTQKKLVAYVQPIADETPRSGESSGKLTAQVLRPFLMDLLPDYMVPALYVIMEALPLNANGKIDRRALPAPNLEESAKTISEPRTPTEEVLASIWSDLFRVEQVSIDEDFFEMGGHSLLATQVISRVRQAFSVEMPLQTLFLTPTITGFAAKLDAEKRKNSPLELPPLVAITKAEKTPLSYAQQRLWFLDHIEALKRGYNISLAHKLSGPLHIDVLEQSVQAMIARHEALRTSFPTVAGEPEIIIRPPGFAWFSVVDLSEIDAGPRLAAYRSLCKVESLHRFDLGVDPLLRVVVIRLTQRQHILAVTMHHIISDGWSVEVMVREMTALYQAILETKPSPLPPLTIQYSDFASWQRKWLKAEYLEAQMEYWRDRLEDMPPLLPLPTDRARPAIPNFRGSAQPFQIGPEITKKIRALGRRKGMTTFMTLLAAFKVLLARYSGTEDIVVGTPVANRNHQELEPLVGFFVNLLALRSSLAGCPNFEELLVRVREAALGAYAHQELPFEQVVDAIQPERNLSYMPLFQSMFLIQNTEATTLQLTDVEVSPIEYEHLTSKVDLLLGIQETSDGFEGFLEYSLDLFDATTARRMADHYLIILEAVINNPSQPLHSFTLLNEAERIRVLYQWNETKTDYPTDQCSHQLFEAWAERTPDAIAVARVETAHLDQAGAEQELKGDFTYADLNEQANRLAHHLRTQGVGVGDLVGISAKRSPETILFILAIFKAGAGYLPLDANYPAERLEFMLTDAGATTVVAQEPAHFQLSSVKVQVVYRTEISESLAAASTENLKLSMPPASVAYLTYTSGSTGKPKAVETRHFNVARLCIGQDYIAFDQDIVFLQIAPISFDASTFEIYSALFFGGRLVVYPDRPVTIQDLGQVLKRNAVNATVLTVSLFNLVVDEAPQILSGLRYLMSGGEALSVAHIRKAAKNLPDTKIVNCYGPTESTSIACTYQVPEELPEQLVSIPLGRPIANTTTYILDAQMEPLPIGIFGQLFIGGDGLASGYRGRPGLTATQFVPDPYGEAGGRLYRSGDIVRYFESGHIEYQGRSDNQVKLRGFRIELGEIENVLNEHESVDKCLAIISEDAHGQQHLVAYLTTEKQGDSELDQLREYLTSRLPAYMVPTYFRVIEAFPLTTSGKVDRQRLPKPQQMDTQTSIEMPVNQMERQLAELWTQLLDVGAIDRHADFFLLGGHSLLVMRLSAKVTRVFGVTIPLHQYFQTPTIATMSETIRDAIQSGQHAHPIRPVSRQNKLPLSYAQQRLWLVHQMQPDDRAYHLPFPIQISGRLNVSAMKRALGEIMERHEILRTSIALEGSQPVQEIQPLDDRLMSLVDLRELPQAKQKAETERLTKVHAQRKFDLGQGPLARFDLVQTAEQEYVLLANMHHIAADVWSLDILVEELRILYQAYSSGQETPLPALPIQYADYAAWERERLQAEEYERLTSYWQKQLKDYPKAPKLPGLNKRTPNPSNRAGQYTFAITKEQTASIHKAYRAQGTTLFIYLLTAFKILVHSHTRATDLVVGTDHLHRDRPEVSGLIGFFLNQLALRTDAGGDPSFQQYLERVKETTLSAYAHQDMPFDKLVELMAPTRELNLSPIFNIKYVLQNQANPKLELPNLQLKLIPLEGSTTKLDFQLNMWEEQEQIKGLVSYKSDLYDGETVERLIQHYQFIIDKALEQTETKLTEFQTILENSDRQREQEQAASLKTRMKKVDFTRFKKSKTKE